MRKVPDGRQLSGFVDAETWAFLQEAGIRDAAQRRAADGGAAGHRPRQAGAVPAAILLSELAVSAFARPDLSLGVNMSPYPISRFYISTPTHNFVKSPAMS